MNNLRRIGNCNIKRPDYLGLIGSFFIEALDHDKIIKELAPKYFEYWDENQKRLFGPDARLILKNFHKSFIVVIRSRDESFAEVVAFAGSFDWLDLDKTEDIKRLASHRWPNLILRIKKSKIKKTHPSVMNMFKQVGWVESPKNNQLQIQLYDR